MKKSSSSVKNVLFFTLELLFFTLEKKSIQAGFRYVAHVLRWMGAYLTYLELATGKDKRVIIF
jgi:hypothetical protein